MKIEFLPSDLNFCIYLLMSYPFASDHETESMLDEFISDHYQMPDQEWQTELTGEAKHHNGNDAQDWNGTTLQLEINEAVTLFVEYHPYETIFFFNEVYLGNTGGHFRLSLLKWTEFLQIIENRESSGLLFFLLLTLVVGAADEKEMIRNEIEQRLKITAFKAEHHPIIAMYLSNHVVFDEDDAEMFFEDPKLGTCCKRNHSERNPKNNEEEIIMVNEVIKLAMRPS
ncbi:Imm19 family immunity protein [Pedobacter caeni]|uniref:Immunity protein 19 n=1 Tax=Pedobacter caeni TaxID=288992 RepID=A0A1M4W8S4_9SPHI|nr:Imm19 family immunity protein [Pedobacter caeni]SHE77607.1 Immunity protein 19 [Pedobacter caeni]